VNRLPPELREQAARARLIIFDVDGVLTDGALHLGTDGNEYVSFHVRDGLGFALLHHSGLETAVISGRNSEVVRARLAALGVGLCYLGRNDKGPACQEMLEHFDLAPARAAYVGDDLVDLPAMETVGLSIAVADAHPLVKERADWVTRCGGGRGAAREVCEAILDAQGAWEGTLATYLARGRAAPGATK